MLIYVNQFELQEPDSFNITCKTISGWLKTVIKRHFTISELLSGDEFSIGKAKVRTYSATELNPKLYSILLSHPDHSVRGRQWITEIGIKHEDDITTVSILLETSDISTLVKGHPNTTRPKLVSFLLKNGTLNPTTVGLRVNNLQNDTSSFKALAYEIDRKERNYPLVFISNKKSDNKPLINPNKLQEQLVGLAQVVTSKDEINSWELEKVLSSKYSAWGGAINIIYPSYGRNECKNRLMLKDRIIELIELGEHLIQYILSYITHTTNGYNKKRHFSPTDVRAKRQKDSRIQLKKRFSELNNDSEYESLAEQAFEQLDEQENVINQLKKQHQNETEEHMVSLIETQEQLDKSKTDYHILKSRFELLQNHSSKTGGAIVTFGNEDEKYSGEITDLVLDAIKALSESSQLQSRKHQLLTDILKYNAFDSTRDNHIEKLKQIFNNYKGMNPKIKSALKTIGFEVVEDGNHNHLRFIDDDRYKVVFAKTPSDTRVGANIIRDIRAELL